MRNHRLKIFNSLLLLLAGAFYLQVACAENLLTVYRQALANDPTFKQDYATMRANRQALPISVANLLPTVSANGSIERSRNSSDSSGADKAFYYANSGDYSLNLSQPIFDAANWAQVANATATAKQADATFADAAQSLILRTATAYFAVLKAEDFLRFTTAERISIAKQLEQAEQQYKVGLIPITNFYEAKASFDGKVAAEIAAKDDLKNKREALWEITSNRYQTLSGIKGKDAPLLKPDPENIDEWVTAAEKQNYALTASHYAALAAEDYMKQMAAGHLPTLNATGGFQYQYSDHSSTGVPGFTRNKAATIGLNMTLPIYQGGAITAQTRQADYLYQKTLGSFEQTHRQVVSQTRQDYLGIMAQISKIRADKQVIISSRSAAESTEAAYKVGMRTMSEVLEAQSKVYAAEKDYSKDQYDYIVQTLSLKKDTGVLAVQDLEKVNSWLVAEDSALTAGVNHGKDGAAVSKKAAAKPKAASAKKGAPKKSAVAKGKPLYTIQLIVSKSEAKVKKMILDNNLTNRAIYFDAYHNKQRVYVLVVGAYQTSTAAQKAISSLPASLQTLKPIVRKIKA